MVLVVILGQMDNTMMDNGWMDLSMDLVCGEDIEEIPIKDNGSLENLKDMAYILG